MVGHGPWDTPIVWRPSYSKTRRWPNIWKVGHVLHFGTNAGCASKQSLNLSTAEGDSEGVWASASAQNDRPTISHDSSFAPRGKPKIPLNFRNTLPSTLRPSIPSHTTAAAIHNACSVRIA